MLLTYKTNAKHAWTLEKEMKMNFQVESGEQILFTREIRFAELAGFWFPRGYLVLTNKRLTYIKHYLFRPDVFYSVGPKDLLSVEIKSEGINHWPIISLTYQRDHQSYSIKMLCCNLGYRRYGLKNNEKKTRELFRLILKVKNEIL